MGVDPERARRASELLRRHVRLQRLSEGTRAEIHRILGEVMLEAWLHEGADDAIVQAALELFDEGHVHVRVTPDSPDPAPP